MSRVRRILPLSLIVGFAACTLIVVLLASRMRRETAGLAQAPVETLGEMTDGAAGGDNFAKTNLVDTVMILTVIYDCDSVWVLTDGIFGLDSCIVPAVKTTFWISAPCTIKSPDLSASHYANSLYHLLSDAGCLERVERTLYHGDYEYHGEGPRPLKKEGKK